MECVKPPTRLGFTIKPSFESLILVSKRARISRPSAKLKGLDGIIKNDQIKSRIDKVIDADINVFNAAKVVSSETIEEFARRVADIHKPLEIDWHARFGLSRDISAPPSASQSDAHPAATTAPIARPLSETPERRNSKLKCVKCEAAVSYSVAKFCWFNKTRFQGHVYCMECQKGVSAG